jgi:hypothetical protein
MLEATPAERILKFGESHSSFAQYFPHLNPLPEGEEDAKRQVKASHGPIDKRQGMQHE